MNIEIFKSMAINLGLLILLAQIFARIRVVRKSIVYENESIKEQLFLIFIFSIMGIISNYTGYQVNGAIANTRVIGVMGSGFIAGPIVALGVALIASIHRILIDISGFTTIPCAISTLLSGMIVIVFSRSVKENKFQGSKLFIITFLVESLQMLIILLLARPFQEAFFIVKNIFLPMTLFNSIGMVLFVGIFKNIIEEQERKVGKKVNLAFDISQKCLPIIQTGKYNKETCKKISRIILRFSNDLGVAFTDRRKVLSVEGEIKFSQDTKSSIEEIVKKIIEENKVIITEEYDTKDLFQESLKDMIAIGAPLTKNKEVFGTIIIFSRKYRISYDSQIHFTDGLSKLLSTQYELAGMEKQKELLAQEEYKVLQSQINPHFIFNSLNTISSFIREKPSDARELLIALATYFRNSIERKDSLISIYEEIEYVDAFLQLVKARFGDRLEISLDIPDGLDCRVPCLVVQPIVENAVIHGAMKRKLGRVDIIVREVGNLIKISIKDNGFGIPQNIIRKLEEDQMKECNIGLVNVDKRLKYIYGEDKGLEINSNSSGTTVNINIKKDQEMVAS